MKNEHFIKKVARRKQALGISKETMSEWLDVTTITLSQIESGNAELDINMCLILAEKLDIPIEEIFECKREKPVRSRGIVILSALAGILLVVNIVLLLCGKTAVKYNVDNYCYYTVLDVEDDMVSLKERFPATLSDSEKIYWIHRENPDDDTWSEVADGDVIMMWYHSKLSPNNDNSSDEIIDLKVISALKVY